MLGYNQQELTTAIMSMGGVVGFLLSKKGTTSNHLATNPQLAKSDQCGKAYERAIDLLKTTSEDLIEIRLGETKILTYNWDNYYFAIEVVVHHAVNKSLRRSMRRLRKKYDKGVQFQGWRSPSQPAASSNDEDESSPSPAGATPSTGDSPAAALSLVNPSSTPPHENSERKPASPWDPKPT